MKLQMSVDFSSDMIPMAWDLDRLRKFMRMNAEMGVKRVCWIYHGERGDGFWENIGMPWRDNYAKTSNAIGDSYLKAAAGEAHAAGLEIFAVYKPFDLAAQIYPTADKARSGRMPVAGGSLECAFTFVVENRDALMRRRNVEKVPAAQIILKTEAKLDSSHQFRIWASDDNWEYRPNGSIVSPQADGFNVIFDISGRTEKFFAIESLSPGKVSNRLDSIIEVRSPDGRKVQRALGLIPRKYGSAKQTFHLKHEFDVGGGFSKEGFYFDYIPGIPSAVGPAAAFLSRSFSLNDNGQNVIGVSLEINEYVPGAPEPAEPKAVEYWLSMIGKALEHGADGVDIRITNHNSILDWAEYGFNQPVAEEYSRRCGVDPRAEPYDAEKFRRLRGEFYTAFLEKAAASVKNFKRKFCLHVPDMAFGAPSESTMMEIHWNWRDWLEKMLPDEVTFKTIVTDSAFSQEGLELIRLCHAKAIPISVCPFLHTISDLAGYLDKIEGIGADALNVYESATVWRAIPRGFKELNPHANEILRKKFRE